MIYLRAQPPSELAGISVTEISDLLYESLSDPENYRMGGSTDVVSLYLSEDHRTRVTVRPSGTEPKLKVYVQNRSTVGNSLDAAKAQGDAVAAGLGEAILEHCGDGLAGALRHDWDRSIRRTI